jgi:hypothetical protein
VKREEVIEDERVEIREPEEAIVALLEKQATDPLAMSVG